MAHNRILKAEYNPETHTSVVSKSSQYGVFTHTVVCQEPDYDVENKFDGCRFAETRCDRDISLARLKDMRSRYYGAKHMYNVLCLQSGAVFADDHIVQEEMFSQVENARIAYLKAKDDYEGLNRWCKWRSDHILKVRRNLRDKADNLHKDEE